MTTLGKLIKKRKGKERKSRFFPPFLLDNKEKELDLDRFFSQRTPEWKFTTQGRSCNLSKQRPGREEMELGKVQRPLDEEPEGRQLLSV